LAANYLGVLNHFIFISVPLSLFVFLLAELVLRKDWELLNFFLLSAVNLAAAAVLYAVKPPITEAQWQAHRLAFGMFFLAVPLAAASVFPLFLRGAIGPARRFLERASRGE